MQLSRYVLLTALLAVVIAAPAHAVAEGSFQRTLQVTGTVDLDVTTGSGDITVRTGSASTVQISARIRAHGGVFDMTDPREKVRRLEADPPVRQAGNYIRIGRIEDSALRNNVSISYDIVVPPDTRLTSETGSGNQDISGIRGPVKANAGSGDVKLRELTGQLRAETGSGNMRLENVSGEVYANAGSGDIHLQGKLPQSRVETGSGNVEVAGVRGSVRANAGSGDITIEGAITSNWFIETGSGNVRLRLPSDSAFTLAAETGSCEIETDHPLTVSGSVRRHEMRGRVRGGGPTLEVHTGSGDIEIR